MEKIGEIRSENLCENKFKYEWHFRKVAFNKSYRSPYFEILLAKMGYNFQMAILPDDSQNVAKFYIFLYGYEEKSRPKMTFSASFGDKNLPTFNVRNPDLCLGLEASMKVFEIQSQHPLLFTCEAYTFQLEVEIHEDSITTLSNRNAFPEETAEEGTASSNLFGETLTNELYLRELSQDMRSLYISGDMCDLEILVGEEILRAHKLILCARSPVFKIMMEHDCLESLSNSITITDCSASQFVKFLKYLYTGEIEGGSLDTVMSLYSLGDKYDVPVLKQACSNILQSKLSSEESLEDVANIVCNVLQLAECHGDLKLKDIAASFIVNHFPIVSNKQGWKDLMKNNFELISNILALVASGLHKQVYKTS